MNKQTIQELESLSLKVIDMHFKTHKTILCAAAVIVSLSLLILI